MRANGRTGPIPLIRKFEHYTMPITESGCLIWIGRLTANGYGFTELPGTAKVISSHRLAWKLFRGEIPSGLHVLHKCDIKCCVNPNHLFLGTQLDNMRDMINKGRFNVGNRLKGENNQNSRLSNEQVLEIKLELKTGRRNMSKLSRRFGVSHTTIRDIKIGKVWQTVTLKDC